MFAGSPAQDNGDRMRLRLTYAGYLRAGEANADDKHALRKHFHAQLEHFWSVHPALNRREVQTNPTSKAWKDVVAEQYPMFHRQWVPLVRKSRPLECSVHLLMLRDDPPGSVINSGDLDRRVTTVIDGLRMPRFLDELGKDKDAPPEQTPIFCLLEDDSLITQLSVETDTLLERVGEHRSKQGVRLVIRVDLSQSNDWSVS